jgi:hypothetical protein
VTPESITNFLTFYIRSLSEETRQGAKGPRYGFDRVIHELALADDLVPVRLSFYRQGEDELSRPKKEPEHGVDQSFISRDGKRLGGRFSQRMTTTRRRRRLKSGLSSTLRKSNDSTLRTRNYLV